MGRKIKYVFKFEDESQLSFALEFDDLMNLQDLSGETEKSWTSLEHNKCKNCPLDSSEHDVCPVANNLDEIVESTKNKLSYEKASVYVETEERTYYKKTDTQEGLLSLFGVIMATSGCPHLNWFKPLARYHLPFSTLDETMFRILSMNLVSEYFSGGEESKIDFDKIKAHYAEVEKVNLDFIERIRSYCKGDADANAIAALDLFAKLFSFEMESNFESIKKYFG